MNSTVIETIKDKLNSSDEEARRDAVMEFPSLPLEDAKTLLIKAIGDKSWRVRKTTMEIMPKLYKADELIPLLIEALRAEDNAGLRNSSVEALVSFGERVLGYLKKYFNDKDSDIRKFIVDIIGGIGSDKSITDLIWFTNDPDDNVKMAAVEALGSIGGKKAVEPLIKLLKTDDVNVKFSVLEALSNMECAVPLTYIYEIMDNRLLRKAALDLLKHIGDATSVPYVLEGLREHSRINMESSLIALKCIAEKYPDVKDELRRQLKEMIDNSAIEKAINALDSPTIEIRKGAVFLFGLLMDVSFIPHLLNTLKDERMEEEVEEVIVSMGASAVPVLMEDFSKSGKQVKTFICHLLGRLNAKDAEDILIESLKDDNGHLRASAALALGRLSSEKAIDPLINLMQDTYVDVRTASIKALSMIVHEKSGRITEKLSHLLEASSSTVRMNALLLIAELCKPTIETVQRILSRDLLESFSKKVLFAIQDEEPAVRKTAIDVTGRLEIRNGIDEVTTALADEVPEVRQAAAKTLGILKNDKSVDALLLSIEDSNLWVKCEAIESLGRIGTEETLDKLQSLSLDKEGIIAIKAIEALKNINPDASKIFFLKALKHNDTEVKKTALEALQNLRPSKELEAAAVELLQNDEWSVRNEAAKTLLFIGAPSLVTHLKDILQKEADPTVKASLQETIKTLSLKGTK